MVRERTKAGGISDIDRLRADLPIDTSNLDDAVIQHPILFEEVAQLFALAVSNRDSKKEYLKHIEGRVMDTVRDDLVASGIAKPTVKAIDGAMSQDVEWIRERDEYMGLSAKADQIGALKEAFMARGYALHSITQIYVTRLKCDSGVYE